MASLGRPDNAFHASPKVPKGSDSPTETQYATKVPGDGRAKEPKGPVAGEQVRPVGGKGRA